jgi:hypothetical protein
VHLSYFITITVKKLNYILILFFVGLLSLPLASNAARRKDAESSRSNGAKDPGRCPYCESIMQNKGNGRMTKRQPNFSNITNHVSTKHPEEYEYWAASRSEKSKSAVGGNQDKGDKLHCDNCGHIAHDVDMSEHLESTGHVSFSRIDH